LLPQPFGVLLAKLGMVNIYHPPTCGRVLEHDTDTHTLVPSNVHTNT
jgi:hypothetical protein